MRREAIIDIQHKIGVVPDGFWGVKSIEACQRHCRRLMPIPNPWPVQSEAALIGFYGMHGNEDKLVNLYVGDLDVQYDGGKVKTVRVHNRIAAALRKVLEEVAIVSPETLREYCGGYNNRPMRGLNKPSLHAYGAAVDFRAYNNGNHQHWPASADMPFKVIEAFSREGFLSAGVFWQRDSMHFQATT